MSVNANPAVGDLRRQRRRAGLSQQRLAELADCSISMIRLLESGYQPSSSDVIERIVRVLSTEDSSVVPAVDEGFLTHAAEARLRSRLAEVEQERAADVERWQQAARDFNEDGKHWKERAERAEAALREIGLSLDLSDDYTFDHTAPGALVSCTRDIESWKRIRAALASVPSSLDAPKENDRG